MATADDEVEDSVSLLLKWTRQIKRLTLPEQWMQRF